MFWFSLFIVIFTFSRLIISFSNLVSNVHLKRQKVKGAGKVSVLIPARNEEQNIARLLSMLYKQNYPNFEVFIYNDASEDNTEKIVEDFCLDKSNFSLINGTDLPENWLGKNHACYQLSLKASGDYLLFLDADIRIKEDLITSSLAFLKKNELSLLSIFPVQEMKSFGEKITVPIMNWILTSLLPLIFIKNKKWFGWAAANGQFMLFEAENYRANNWHQKVKHEAVEDILIAKKMKQQNYKIHTILSNGAISCTMYSGFSEAINGFSKNVLQFFSERYFFLFVFLSSSFLGMVLVPFFLPIEAFLFYLSNIILIKVFTSICSKQNTFQNLILAPVQQLVFIYLIASAILKKQKKNNVWKGRKI